MRTYKPKYTTKEGTKIESPTWWIDFKWKRRRCRLPGFTSLKQTEAFGRRMEELMSSLASGQTPDASLVKWMQSQGSDIQKKLADLGLLEGRFAVGGRPLADHLTEWKQVLLAKGNTPYHAERYFVDARRILQLSKTVYLRDLTPSRVQVALDRIGKGDDETAGLSLQTLNHFLRAIKAFTRWLVSDRRATEDPLAHLKGFNVKTDRRHDRRALSEEEVERLLAVADQGEVFLGISGSDRGMLYRLALGTGFRSSELRSLTPESFNLDTTPPTLTVAAAYSKHRRTDVQPIQPSLASAVAAWLATKAKGKSVFATMPAKWHVAKLIRHDLLVARVAWLKEANGDAEELARRQKLDFLAYRDGQQCVADFHALRHTFITRLVSSGAPMKAAQELARHSTPTLTLGRYAHAGMLDTSKALSGLPNVPGVTKPPVGSEDASQKPPGVNPKPGSQGGST